MLAAESTVEVEAAEECQTDCSWQFVVILLLGVAAAAVAGRRDCFAEFHAAAVPWKHMG